MKLKLKGEDEVEERRKLRRGEEGEGKGERKER